ncbi:MAG: hypothetical protein J6A88_01160 [Oscillospiraceae bacterium]|nr:hypothetical protein [Oscillospiraceae bacterium]
MKKLISLVMVLSLVLCLATAALASEPAAGTKEDPIVVTDISELASVNVPSGEIKWFLLPAAWSGKVLNFSAPMSGPAIYIIHPMMGFEFPAAENFMAASYGLEGYGSDILIGLGSSWGYEIVGGTCELVEPVEGSEMKPAVLTDISNPITVTGIQGQYGFEYFMTWTNSGAGGNLTINGVTGSYDVIEMNTDSSWASQYPDNIEPAKIGVASGETVKIVVRGETFDTVTLDLSFEPFKEGESQYTPFDVPDQDKAYTFEAVLNPNSEVFYKLTDVSGAILTIYDAHAYVNGYGDCYVEWIDDGDDDVLTAKVYVYGGAESVVVGIGSNSSTDVKYTVTVSEPLGYDENPIKIEKLDKIEAEIAGGTDDSMHYSWVATETGKVTMTVTGAEWTEEALYQAAIYDEETFEVIGYEDVKPQVTVFVNGVEVISGTEVVFDVKAGDKVIIKVQSLPIYEYEDYGYGAYIDVEAVIDPLGSMNNPIIVNDPSELGGIDVPAGEKVYIAISSMLNGQVLTIAGDANTVVYNRTTPVAANNGMFVVELTGVPSNMIVVENKGDKDASYIAGIAFPAGSENNPIIVNDPSELGGIDVPAGEKVYIAVSSMLNGQVLTVVGDANTAVSTRAGAVAGDNGIFAVELNGVPANMIVVENKGNQDASYIAVIEYPVGSETNPVVLNAMSGAINASAEAGSTTYYIVNGSYNGKYIVVKGSGLSVTVNGKELKAVNGEYFVKLDGTPVNAIVVANSGSGASAYSISIIESNPDTGDSGILVAMAAAIIALTGAVVLVANKKED